MEAAAATLGSFILLTLCAAVGFASAASAAAEVFMPIRIKRHDKSWQGTQVTEARGTIAALADGSTACYAGRKPKFRILCGSV